MSEINIYFEKYNTLFTPEVVSLLAKIEQCFSFLNYEHHHDDLDRIFLDYPNATAGDLAHYIRESYIEHIIAVLQVQGIQIKLEVEYPIQPLVNILTCTVLLNALPVSEFVELVNLDSSLSGDVYFSEIVHLLTNEDLVTVINLIAYVSSNTIDLLKADHELIFDQRAIANHSADRFKNSPIVKEGEVTTLLRSFEDFGYSLTPFFTHLSEPLNLIKDPEVLSNEIILLVLGSNTVDEHLLNEALAFAEKIIMDASLRLKTLVKIDAYFKS